jgi:NAD(P)-dependent dehydrogenase (short-subunit alcohol dehydrogenase family)
MNTILVTGSNRGLGLEWVRQCTAEGWRVIATCRDPRGAADLQALARDHDALSVHALDVTRPQQIRALADELRNTAVDLLINNAGVYHERWGKDPVGGIDYGDWMDTFAVNTLGPMRVSEALVDCMARSERRLIVAITSHMGSIADITSPRDYAYRSSKAALNAAMKGLAAELAPRNIGVLLLHPGWVRTRMGGESAPVTPEQSVRGMRERIAAFALAQSGRFYRFDGTAMPW